MKLIKPSYQVLTPLSGNFLGAIEAIGRTCYKSEDRITSDSYIKFCKMLIKNGHESVIEHCSISVRFVVDRGVSHELVRHRLCSFSQESTRYCNYSGGVTFIIPPWVKLEPGDYVLGKTEIQASPWLLAMYQAEFRYSDLLALGWTPQQARSVLPNSLKTEIVITANIREWRHILKLRTSTAAHPQMVEIMRPLLAEFKDKIPVLFDDIP